MGETPLDLAKTLAWGKSIVQILEETPGQNSNNTTKYMPEQASVEEVKAELGETKAKPKMIIEHVDTISDYLPRYRKNITAQR